MILDNKDYIDNFLLYFLKFVLGFENRGNK